MGLRKTRIWLGRGTAVFLIAWCAAASAQTRGSGSSRGSSGTSSQGRSSSGSSSYSDYGSNTSLGSAMIEIDPETRSLIVVADEETGAEIARILKDLDKPKPQVLIKVLFAEVTYGNGLDLGVEGIVGYTGKNLNQGTVESAWGVPDELDDFVNNLAGGFWTMMGDNWEVRLRALAESGKLEVLSRPSILARNNQEAVIIVGEEVPLVTNSQITDTGQTLNTIQYSDVGIILRVTPFITSDDTVEMIVAPEISNIADETVTVSETVNSPVITKRSAETVVVTPNGETVVIGGLMESQRINSVQKIPILGDIPIVGMAFRRTIIEDIKKELLIFLTPYIVEKPSDLAALSRREAKSTDLMKKAFSEEDLKRYMDHPILHEEEAVEEEAAEEEAVEE